MKFIISIMALCLMQVNWTKKMDMICVWSKNPKISYFVYLQVSLARKAPAPATLATSAPAFSAPLQPTTTPIATVSDRTDPELCFVKVYNAVTTAITNNKYGCSENHLRAIKEVLAQARFDGANCQKSANDCIGNIVGTILGHYRRTLKMLNRKCADPSVKRILKTLGNLLNVGSAGLVPRLEYFINFIETASPAKKQNKNHNGKLNGKPQPN